jgi:Domain of unknown function (DUF1707)
MDDASVRVSDAEREQAVLALREHLLAGRLTLEEFTDRVGAALGARVHAELTRAHSDLPELFATAAGSRRTPTRLIGALFSHVTRRGRLRLGKRALAVSVLGDVDLDLRDVVIDQWQTTLIVVPALGNVDVYVPEGVNTVLSGGTLLGHSRDWGQDIDRADAPVVRIRVLGAGTVDVWRVPRDMGEASHDEIIRRLEGRKELPG